MNGEKATNKTSLNTIAALVSSEEKREILQLLSNRDAFVKRKTEQLQNLHNTLTLETLTKKERGVIEKENKQPRRKQRGIVARIE